MNRTLRYMTIVLCLCLIGGISAGAAQKKQVEPRKKADTKASAAAIESPAGIYEGINTEYDNYVMATYNFTGNKVKIATEKEDIDCVWKIEGTALSLYYIVEGKPSNEVYESWIWNESKKSYTMKDAAGLILKKKGK